LNVVLHDLLPEQNAMTPKVPDPPLSRVRKGRRVKLV